MQKTRINNVSELRLLMKQMAAKKGYQFAVVPVDAALAQDILDNFWLGTEDGPGDGPRQRTIYQGHVRKLSRQMRNGSFSEGTDTIAFLHPDVDEVGGALGNGYHRLFGLVDADVELDLVFQFNCTRDDLLNFDQARARGIRDAANVMGMDTHLIEKRRTIASMCKRHKQGLWPVGNDSSGNAEVFSMLENMDERLAEAAEMVMRFRGGLRSKSFGFAYIYFAEAGYATDADLFFDALAGEDFEPRERDGITGPIRLLSQRLRADYDTKGNQASYTGQRRDTDILVLTIAAFNHFLKDWTGKKLQLPKGWPLPSKRLRLPPIVKL